MAYSRIQQYDDQLRREFDQEQAENLIDESPPALREKVEWIRNYLDDEWRRSITGRYQLALVIKQVYDDVKENNGAVYGARAVDALKKAFGWKEGIIYQALHVADTFTPQQIDEITRMRLPDG